MTGAMHDVKNPHSLSVGSVEDQIVLESDDRQHARLLQAGIPSWVRNPTLWMSQEVLQGGIDGLEHAGSSREMYAKISGRSSSITAGCRSILTLPSVWRQRSERAPSNPLPVARRGRSFDSRASRPIRRWQHPTLPNEGDILPWNLHRKFLLGQRDWPRSGRASEW